MTRSFIVAAKRSAVVPLNGSFAALDHFELAAPVIQGCLKVCGLAPTKVDDLIAGNALGAGGNPARLMALASGLPETVAGLSLDRQCCSGLDAIVLADALIRSGTAEVIVAGGSESYSRRPSRAHRFPGNTPDQPYEQARFTPWPERDPDMHAAADNLAKTLGIDREAQDAWAIRSHKLARRAKKDLSREIIPLNGVQHDPFTRDLTEKLCTRAKPICGSITPANTSVAADAAAFCIVVSESVARQLDAPAMEVIGGRTVGGCPDVPGLAPVTAINSVLSASGLAAHDLATAEIMEAYAAQAIACVSGAGLHPDIVNRGGGSLARGHPIGASGAVNAVRLWHEMTARNGYGIAAIAAAGGLGTALLLRSAG